MYFPFIIFKDDSLLSKDLLKHGNIQEAKLIFESLFATMISSINSLMVMLH